MSLTIFNSPFFAPLSSFPHPIQPLHCPMSPEPLKNIEMSNFSSLCVFNNKTTSEYYLLIMNNLVGVILDVAKNSSKGRSILTKVSKDAARALDNLLDERSAYNTYLSGVALSVELAETAPFTKGLALRDLNEGNVVLLAESLGIEQPSDPHT